MIKDLSNELRLKAYAVYSELKYEAFYSVNNEPFLYPPKRILNRKRLEGDPTTEETRVILFTFQEEGVVKILREYADNKYSIPDSWLIEVVSSSQFSKFEVIIQDSISTEGVYLLGNYKDSTKNATLLSAPTGWELIDRDQQPEIKKDSQVVFQFRRNDSRKYKYFEYLFDHYGQKIDYKTIYEYGTKLIHPTEKGKLWKVNAGIRNQIYKLIKEFGNLPIKIKIVNKTISLVIGR